MIVSAIRMFSSHSRLLAAVLLSCALIGCSSKEPETSPNNLNKSNAFTLSTSASADFKVKEGDDAGLTVPFTINRLVESDAPITLSVRGLTPEDSEQLKSTFSATTIEANNAESNLTVSVAIDALPIKSHQRTLVVSATDGQSTDEFQLTITVQPTDAPDIYLLVGQSNMVGFSGDGTKQAEAGGPDEPHHRIKQLNVTYNDEWGQFNDPSKFRNVQSNIVSPAIIKAEDPLHLPLNPDTNQKDGNYIGMGLSFAKAALPNTTANIVLVPSAWSGTAFCANEGGPTGQWNASSTDNPALGNTLLFDRAVVRTNEAIERSGGVLRGILWHQGESDANEACATSYLANIERLAQQFRLQIKEDRRGGEFRRADAPIPFILGTMSRGFDERGDLSIYSRDKQLIDDAHRQLPTQLPFVATSVHDDLVGNQWPCGNTTCIHFGAEALREMGNRYYQRLVAVMTEGQ